MKAVYLNQAAINCTLGISPSQVGENLFGADCGSGFLTTTDRYSPGNQLPLGLVSSALPQAPVPGEDSRNNRLLSTAIAPLLNEIEALKVRYGSERIGLVVGTSTSGIAECETALQSGVDGFRLDPEYSYKTQEFSAPVRFLSRWLGIDGPAWVVSTACTSGGKALASASRLLGLGICDAVIAGGVDTLCRMTVAGFSSLMVTSGTLCNPFSVNRNGINIGEGGAFFLLTHEPGPVRLAGFGETSDAYHISSPDPRGKGAQAAMALAIRNAGISKGDIDYINLHGTATEQNDLMEACSVSQIFGNRIACSSTKPLTGHTLAAAGAVEAFFCWLLLQRTDGLLPPHLWDGEPDPALPALAGLAQREIPATVKYAMSNSFAFGGNNLSLILARE